MGIDQPPSDGLTHLSRTGQEHYQPPQESASSPAGYSQTDPIADSMIGKQISHYRIVARLARGGMGEVYRAVRTDDEYKKDVALKVVSKDRYSPEFVKRFRNEQHILATLDHPNIAHLYDAGSTEDGTPYFVMELIEGENIVAYCEHHRLSVSDRLQLFLQVCSAVDYAHHHLIVHRDIKPDNVLVTREGIAKLTDFGIAKILNPDNDVSGHKTLTQLHTFTPAYASPEQVKGEPITIASDIFSLGVVLYQLLTGQLPYRSAGTAVHEITQEICEEEPERPSAAVTQVSNRVSVSTLATCEVSRQALRKRLSGDLDAIVLQTLRKEPERRHTSVNKLSEDIQRHLENRPVLAQQDSCAYRASKFVSRHRSSIAAGVVVLLLLGAGISVIAYEAHVARVERAQAQRRFDTLRQIAHSLIFDIHDSVRDLPGSTAARTLIVQRALEYLDALSKDAGDDIRLQRELAAAYERVGDVQGNDIFANLGDTTGALASYKKALNIRLQLAALPASTVDDQVALSEIYERLTTCFLALGSISQAADNAGKAYTTAERLATSKKDDPLLQENWAGASFVMARTLRHAGDLKGAAEYYARSASIRESIQSGPADFQEYVRVRLAGAYGYLAGIRSEQGDLDQAIRLQEQSHAILAKLLQSDPHNSTVREFLLQSDFWAGYYLAQKNQTAQALSKYRDAEEGYIAMVAADPRDALAKQYLGMCYRAMAKALIQQRSFSGAIANDRKALKIHEDLSNSGPTSDDDKISEVALDQSTLGTAFGGRAAHSGRSTAREVDDWKQSQLWFQQALHTFKQMKMPETADEQEAAAGLARSRAALDVFRTKKLPNFRKSPPQI